jgi:plastocyanin
MNRRDFLRTAGGATGVAAAASATASAQEGEGGGGGGGGTTTVDMTDALVYDPAEIQVAPGTTVEWVNVGGIGHSVTMYEDSIPDGATYWASGGFDSEEAARSNYPDQGDVAGGESVSHTFETLGEYEYMCIPHESAGMVGKVTVTENPSSGGGGGGGGGEKELHDLGVPIQAHWVGSATILGIIATIVYTFYILKYGESPNTGNTGGRN